MPVPVALIDKFGRAFNTYNVTGSIWTFCRKVAKILENVPEKGAGNSATWLTVRMEGVQNQIKVKVNELY